MNTYTYHKDIRTVLAAVGNVFGGMTISRMVGNEENPTFDQIVIPVVYAPKTRTLNELVNTSKHIKLPIMCYDLKSIQYDQSRAFNKISEYLVPNKIDPENKKHPMPLPVKMSISSSFICRFQEDYHQYVTCLFTYFSPYVEMSYKHPDLDIEVRCRIIWDGNASIGAPEQFSASDPYRITVDASFTVEGWLYKNEPPKGSIIYNIPITFTALSELSGSYEWMKKQQVNGVNTDARIKEGRPIAWYTSTNKVGWFPSSTNEELDKKNPEILIKGDMFKTVEEVAIVDMDPSDPMYAQNEYKYYDKSYWAYKPDGSHDGDKGSHYGPFTGVPATFEIVDDHRLIVTVPRPQKGGRFDVYVIGSCGYGKLSEDSRRPYLSTQMPTTDGIEGKIYEE